MRSDCNVVLLNKNDEDLIAQKELQTKKSFEKGKASDKRWRKRRRRRDNLIIGHTLRHYNLLLKRVIIEWRI